MDQQGLSRLRPATISNPELEERIRDLETEMAVLKARDAERTEAERQRKSQSFQIFITVLGVVVAVGFQVLTNGGAAP